MTRHAALRWARNPWAATLLAVAFLCRALVPVGYMPGAGGLMLCPDYDAPAATQAMNHAAMGHHMDSMDHAAMGHTAMGHDAMGHAGHGHGELDGRHGQHGCPYSGAATSMAATQSPLSLALAQLVPTTLPAPDLPAIPRSAPLPTRLPRGPPAYS